MDTPQVRFLRILMKFERILHEFFENSARIPKTKRILNEFLKNSWELISFSNTAKISNEFLSNFDRILTFFWNSDEISKWYKKEENTNVSNSFQSD